MFFYHSPNFFLFFLIKLKFNYKFMNGASLKIDSSTYILFACLTIIKIIYSFLIMWSENEGWIAENKSIKMNLKIY